MSPSASTIIKFDGPAIKGNTMDAEHLAPSLLALSQLIKRAHLLHCGNDKLRIVVRADTEQHCFELVVEVFPGIWEAAKTLLLSEDTEAVKELIYWLTGTAGAGGGLFYLFKKLKGKKIKSVSFQKNNAIIELEGIEPNVIVKKEVYLLAQDPTAKEQALLTMKPVLEEGYDSMEFLEGGEPTFRIGKSQVPNLNGDDLPPLQELKEETNLIRTKVRIREAIYEGTSAWELVYKTAIRAEMADAEWLKAFQEGKIDAPPKCQLDINLQETYSIDAAGLMAGVASYKVVKVHEVVAEEEPA